MIKFFRRIRKKLLSDNKFSKYLLYATGEIFLVVIGILIALQVNNWNQERLELKEKEVILSKLHEEFKANREALSEYLEVNNAANNAGILIMNLVGSTREELANHNLDSLIFAVLPPSETVFADNAVNNIVESGRLNLFKDENISTLLYQWKGFKEKLANREEKIGNWTNNQTLPFLLQHISFKEMDIQTNYPWNGRRSL